MHTSIAEAAAAALKLGKRLLYRRHHQDILHLRQQVARVGDVDFLSPLRGAGKCLAPTSIAGGKKRLRATL